MKILYCTNLRLPTERVHGRQVAEVCRALHVLGHGVEVVSPFRTESEGLDFTSYYGLPDDVSLTRLGAKDPMASKWLPEFFGFILLNFRFRSLLRDFLKTAQTDALYTRSPVLLPTLLDSKKPVLLELHSIPGSPSFISLANRCTLVVALTTPMRETLIRMGLDASKVIVEGDAVNRAVFGDLPERMSARKEFGIAPDAFVAGYAGQLESMGLSKGIPELIGALETLPDVTGLIAGGPNESRKKFEATVSPDARSRIRFTGILTQDRVRDAYAASDVLIYPAPASDHPFYNRDTSPMKIFEYMASGIPMVCADLPPVRDVVDPSVALLVPPGDPRALADAILRIMKEPEEAKKRADAAKQRMLSHTWDMRMMRVMDAFHERTASSNSAR